MSDTKNPSTATPPAEPGRADARAPYAPPRVVRKKAVTRATLFTGGGGGPPSTTPPLVSNG